MECSVEIYEKGRFHKCSNPATHLEEDLLNSEIEYPLCDDCARTSRVQGFINRKVGDDENWETVPKFLREE